MSQQVRVEREIKFTGDANQEANVDGYMLPKKMSSIDWFDQRAMDTTNNYTVTVAGSGDTLALSAGGKSGVTVLTGANDNDVSFLATGLVFDISQAPVIETKIYITDVSSSLVYFGFSDATSETTPAATIDADGSTLTAAAIDAAGFVIDADKGTSGIYCASVLSGGTVQSVDTGIDWADTISYVLRVALDTSGNARFYVNGVEKGYIALAVADVPLCAIFNFGTRAAGGQQTMYARYLAKFQNIP
uniref:Uncharacterized protein n=1 Tax=viral metagenome TaxID=1070528 RepID=A0A6M3LF69_9ZZZZ